MADTKSTQHSTLTPLRREIARVACYEVLQQANVLQDYIELHDEGDMAPATRGGLMRLRELSEIIFAAVIAEDSQRSDEELIVRIGGKHLLGLEAQHG